MLYVEFLIDDERYELELHPGMVFTKCAKCGQKIYGYCDIDAEIEPLCEAWCHAEAKRWNTPCRRRGHPRPSSTAPR